MSNFWTLWTATIGVMSNPLTLGTVAMLTTAPLLWAGNAIVGRLAHDLISPFALNFVRWALAFVLLLPLAWKVLRQKSPLWPMWRRYALLGLLGIGCYNSLLYLALKTSTPLNATLVSSSMPIWMLALGRIFWGMPISSQQVLGAVLSMLGVVTVLSRGDIDVLWQLQLVPGDLFMLLATLIWTVYTWLLTKTPAPAEMQNDWAAFLMAQLVFGVLWSGLFAGTEAVLGAAHLVPGWPLLAVLLFIAIGPAILAYRFWGAGVQRSSPQIAGFFANLIPLFTALLSIPILGTSPHLYHAVAFVLIVAGIMVSSRR